MIFLIYLIEFATKGTLVKAQQAPRTKMSGAADLTYGSR